MATIREIDGALSAFAPAEYRLDWDNDGMMCVPAPDRRVRRALCVLDVDDGAAEYAVSGGFDLILSHHPLIFRPVKRIGPGKLAALIQHNVAVLSYHTRLDAAPGGVNDRLAGLLGLTGCTPFAQGCGRIGTLARPLTLTEFAARLKQALPCPAVRAADGGSMVETVAVVSGSGGDFLGEAAELGADTFVSGEIGYHRMLDAADEGMNALDIGHDASERHICEFFADFLLENFPDVEAEIYDRSRLTVL